MKTLITAIATVALFPFLTEPVVPRHNVYFAWNSSELKGTSASVIESVYRKLPAGSQVRFGIEGPIANSYTTVEKNEINYQRCNSIIETLKSIGKETDSVQVVDASNPFLARPADGIGSSLLVLEVLLTKAPAWVEPKFTSIDAFLPLPVQSFTINPREDNRLVGAQGTVVNIPAFTLALANGSVPHEMTVELTEVYGNGQIVQASLHTASGGKMLQSGGTIHIDANTNGQKAHVAQGKELDLEFPHGFGEPYSDMEVFNGRIDRKGNFDWVAAGQDQTITTVKESFYINDKQVSQEEYYARLQAWENRKAEQERQQAIATQVAANDAGMDAYLLKSDRLGWINCDRFMDVEQKTDIIVMVDTTLRPAVRMVFENISSVMNGSYDARSGTVRFQGIPVGEPVRLIGYSIMNDIPYMANTQITVSNNLKKVLQLMPITKQQMEAELASLN